MRGTLRLMSTQILRERPLIAFFDYHDVFEDFYPHYGVDQRSFATRWADTANHAWLYWCSAISGMSSGICSH